MGKAPLVVAILPGSNKGVYNIQASSRDGHQPYEGFASAVGMSFHLDHIKGEEPVKLGHYMVRGNQVTAEFNPATNTLTINGIPTQALSQLYVANLVTLAN